MDLDLNSLKTFYAVAKTNSFSKAAKKLIISQSAVSHAMKKLQIQCQHQLIRRKGHKLELTQAGQILYLSLEKIFCELDQAVEKIKQLTSERIGTIRLGATVEFGSTILIKYLQPFLKQHPNLNIDIICKHNPFPLLLKNDLDLMIDCQIHHHPKVHKIFLFKEAYAVIAAPGFLREHNIESTLDLASVPVISLDKEAFWWSSFLNALPVNERTDFSKIIQINHIRGIINATLSEIGVGLVPKYSVLSELETGKLVQLFPTYEHFDNSFYLYYTQRQQTSKLLQALINYLLNLNPVEF